MSKSKITATKSKNRKMLKNINEDKRLMKSMDAFSEETMYYSERDTRSIIDELGITETFHNTTRFDNEW